MNTLDGQRLAAAKLWLTTTPAPGQLSGCGNIPYLATAIYAITAVACADVETMTADEDWRFYVNPGWLETTEIPVVAAEMAHLVWHLLADHADRARSLGVGKAERATWKTASDVAIHTTLQAGHIAHTGLPAAADLKLPKGLSAEENYAKLGGLPATPAPDRGEEPIAGRGSAADGQPRPYEHPHGVDTDGIPQVRAEQIREAVAIAFR